MADNELLESLLLKIELLSSNDRLMKNFKLPELNDDVFRYDPNDDIFKCDSILDDEGSFSDNGYYQGFIETIDGRFINPSYIR